MGKARGWSSTPTYLFHEAPLCSQQTAQVYGILPKKGMHNLKMIAEGSKKDEGSFDMENDGKHTVFVGICLMTSFIEETD